MTFAVPSKVTDALLTKSIPGRDEEELRKSLSELADPKPKSIKRISSCKHIHMVSKREYRTKHGREVHKFNYPAQFVKLPYLKIRLYLGVLVLEGDCLFFV